MSIISEISDFAKKTLFKKDVEHLSETYSHLLDVLDAYPRTSKTEEKEDKFLESVAEFREWDTQLADLIVRRMANQDYRKISLDDASMFGMSSHNTL